MVKIDLVVEIIDSDGPVSFFYIIDFLFDTDVLNPDLIEVFFFVFFYFSFLTFMV